MTTNPTPRSAFKHPATVLAAAALAVAVGGSAMTAQADPVATEAKALGTKKLTVRKAGVEIPAAHPRAPTTTAARWLCSARAARSRCRSARSTRAQRTPSW